MQIACGFQVLGDQRRVFVERPRTALFDRGGYPPVQVGAVGFELSLVCHGTYQRMVKHKLGVPGERDLIDELGRQQVGNHRFDTQCRQQVRSEPRADHRRRAQRSFCCGVEPINTGGDRCLQRSGHSNLGSFCR